MEKIILDECLPIETAGHSSKGNQLKWKRGEYWYKADHMGYEGLTEVVISKLLEHSNVAYYVKYEPVLLQYKGREYAGCKSPNFLRDDEELVTAEHLFRQYTGESLAKKLGQIADVKERILYMVENVERYTGLKDFGKYMQTLLALDAFFLNEDRHTNNIAVIYEPDKEKYRLSPVFDNGLALFSDTATDFPLEKTMEECFSAIEGKPFSRDFDEQLDAGEMLYGCNVKFCFGKKEADNILDACKLHYQGEIIERVRLVLYAQLRKYQYMLQAT